MPRETGNRSLDSFIAQLPEHGASYRAKLRACGPLLLGSLPLQEINEHRLVCEAPVCRAWHQIPNLPTGLRIVQGLLAVNDQRLSFGDSRQRNHTYAVVEHTGQTRVIDFCPAQVVRPGDKLEPGERIAVLELMAPELFLKFDAERVLFASPEAISAQLGLIYGGSPPVTQRARNKRK